MNAEAIQEKTNLSATQVITWQQAYQWQQLPEKKYIMFGRIPETKHGKEFFKPFLQAGYIDKNHLKHCGAFRLTEKGVQKFEELLNELN